MRSADARNRLLIPATISQEETRSITAMLAQHLCVQPATILNWLYFTQSHIALGKVELLAFLMMYHTCRNSQYKYLFPIFENFLTECF